jgi:hypothetical protein
VELRQAQFLPRALHGVNIDDFYFYFPVHWVSWGKKRCSVRILFFKMPCGDLDGSVSIPPNTLQILLEVFRSAQHNSIISHKKLRRNAHDLL